MTLLSNLDTILQDGRKAYERRRNGHDGTGRFYCREQLQHAEKTESDQNEKSKNMLVRGDNLDFMEYLIQNCDMTGKLDLIYIDPPFFSNANYKARTKIQKKGSDQAILHIQDAYTDTWEYGEREYLTMLTERLLYMHELLKDEGCIFIHLDWHIVHYVKVIADEIFGMQNFVNEIIWQYKSGGAGKRHFGRKHDTILFYAKTKKYRFYPQKEKSYNRMLRPYHFKGVQEYQDETGWYTKVYMKDVWPIDMVGRTSKERVDYATQKPEALLERIIQSCTKEGDLCADFFAGSGTLAAAADRLSRNWICCDDGALAIAKMQKRLCVRGSEYDYYEENESVCKEIEQIKIKTCLQSGEVIGKIKLEIVLEMADEHLLDYWSVDYNFDRIHRPEIHFFRTGGEIRTKTEKTAGAFHKISIKITDIGGNVRYEVITV